MPHTRFSVSQVGNSLTWVVVDNFRQKNLVGSSPSYDCALMIAAIWLDAGRALNHTVALAPFATLRRSTHFAGRVASIKCSTTQK